MEIKVDEKRDTFTNMKMLRKESFHVYYCRWKLNEGVYRTCLVDEEHEDPANLNMIIGSQFTLVKRFLMSLDQYRFGELVNKYRNGDRDWPHHVSTAFQQCEIQHNSNVRSQATSYSNRRGAFVANVSQVNNGAPATTKCEICGLISRATSVCRNVLSTNRPGRGGGRGSERSHSGRGRG